MRSMMTVVATAMSLAAYAGTDDIIRAFDFEHMLVYFVAAVFIGVFVLLFYNRLYIYREQQAAIESKSQNGRLALVLQTGKLQLWIYDIATRHYTILRNGSEQSREYNPVEFSEFYERDSFENMRKLVFDICEGKRLSATVTLNGCPDAAGNMATYEMNLSIARRDIKGRPTSILGVQRDVTDEVRRKQHVNQLLMRYHTLFSSSMVDVIFYDANGVLREINEKACQTFGVKNRQQLLRDKFMLQNNPVFSNIDMEHLEDTRTTAIVDFSTLTDERYRLDEFGLKGKIYYESSINPIRNSEGKLEGIYMVGRNVTEMVDSFHHQQEGTLELQEATRSIQEYNDKTNFALRISNVRLVNYYPDRFTLEVSDTIGKKHFGLSQLRCIRLASPRYQRAVSSVLNRMDHRVTRPIEQTFETEFHDEQGRQIWLLFNMVPMFDEQGNVERYFGMCRNVTDMVETERRLAVEKKKAQETELLKQSFLTNMSYEIRTPLNTVVGFAELFEQEHDEADEPVFVEEIKRNSNSLLRLVNDILFISRLDANMIEFDKQFVDFAMIFDSHCQMGWTSINPNVKTVVENPFEHIMVEVDASNLGKVIEKLCNNAARTTTEGMVRAKYEYSQGRLLISVEDTGRGIDEKTLPHVFDRFVRNSDEELCGTGLDLPIVQSLVQQMGGTIEIQSELNKGTVAWVEMPCEMQMSERKVEMPVQ